MDNPESTNSSAPDVPDTEQNNPPVDAPRPREVLEGEVFAPRKQPEEAAEQEEDADAGAGAGTEEPGVARSTVDATSEEARQRESVERGLAQYVFVREEREREVRLTFRDASADDIAHTFRSAGAHLITLSAERTSMTVEPVVTPASQDNEERQEAVEDEKVIEAAENSEEEEPPIRHRGARQRTHKLGSPTGEVLLRYFYSLGEIVYTVSIVSLTGVVTSIASMYPVAARSERELSERLSIVFV